MKIAEPLREPSEQAITGDLRQIESEVLDKMKSEFHDFVMQTRKRLRMVCDTLSELNQELSAKSQVTSQSIEPSILADVADAGEPLPPRFQSTPPLPERTSTDVELDSCERLNAIKQRLARQMKNM